jgi:hypothetical protein
MRIHTWMKYMYKKRGVMSRKRTTEKNVPVPTKVALRPIPATQENKTSEEEQSMTCPGAEVSYVSKEG